MIIGTPTTAHFIYIPFVLLIGIVLGFVLGGRAARDELAMREARKQEREAKRAARKSAGESEKPPV